MDSNSTRRTPNRKAVQETRAMKDSSTRSVRQRSGRIAMREARSLVDTLTRSIRQVSDRIATCEAEALVVTPTPSVYQESDRTTAQVARTNEHASERDQRPRAHFSLHRVSRRLFQSRTQ